MLCWVSFWVSGKSSFCEFKEGIGSNFVCHLYFINAFLPRRPVLCKWLLDFSSMHLKAGVVYQVFNNLDWITRSGCWS